SPDHPKKKRRDTSLGIVTRRLSEVLQSSSDGVVDLNAIAQALSVPKRRLYDVTNVLEGIALTRKTSKNHIEWLGTRCGALSLEVTNLIQKERKLDELIKSCTCQINQMRQDKYNQRYPLTPSTVVAFVGYSLYVQRIPILREQTVIVIKGPAGPNWRCRTRKRASRSTSAAQKDPSRRSSALMALSQRTPRRLS
ncbi:unnamed protein product, partial [Tetraodon nigroviridis]